MIMKTRSVFLNWWVASGSWSVPPKKRHQQKKNLILNVFFLFSIIILKDVHYSC